MRTCGALILLFAIGCSTSSSPTAPSANEPPTQSGPPAISLTWNVTAPSCGNVAAPPTQPAFASATLVRESDTAVTANWPITTNGRSATLYARFVYENNAWGLCSWDIADI
jgi:hypothetical protein